MTHAQAAWPPIPFTKMHGLGNDYLYIDIRRAEPVLAELPWPDVARAMSDRHFGVGSDGIILIAPTDEPGCVARMRIFNADGSESEMCGNGLRAMAKWLYDRGEAGARQRILTGAGILEPEVVEVDAVGRARRIRVNMGAPRFRRRDLGMSGDPEAEFIDAALPWEGEALEATAVSMGNPHAIFFGPLWDTERLASWGPRLEHHPWFTRRVNVHSVEVVDRSHLRMRHWERGAGMTLACGTGAAAAAVAAAVTGRAGRRVTIEVPGGSLLAEWEETSGSVFLTGPAEEVAEGTFARR
ncbi:Diaminopimelate epimerase [Candidatus Hydrogenisulfobacillus filiaventi]|uniref:Diaminopimelate epimerase n=1 Tax=Candidatus Hydrogenisulfobacillus filiaventi TaxID=2707344 RepID=A0A6F8ZF81_9FIRM|nr:diaminopimelate epimerase [Bacillota bacterium]CAB1128528.1 Diaminopimelate epimerase [Candidatus Hydrogenisulfobacillus filiaventi]